MRMRLKKDAAVGAVAFVMLVGLFIAQDYLPNSEGVKTAVVLGVILIFAVLFVIALKIRRERKRTGKIYSKRWCRSCGYDLRATPGRCPECGKVPESGA